MPETRQRTALVTGASGFIGYHLSRTLLESGWRVHGIDNLCDYYDVSLKCNRQEILQQFPDFSIENTSIETRGVVMDSFARMRPDVVIHLAAQAGIRYSIENPRSYLESNICGTFEILEAARVYPPAHMLLASTSSAYGADTEMPYRETQQADHQISFYAATKKATETMAHSYAHLYNLPITMFRFFTVYGPWGRPDMAIFKFTKAILDGVPIDVYNNGDMRRDFTYISDLVDAICLLIDVVPARPHDSVVTDGDSLSPVAPWRLVNIGNSEPVPLMDFIVEIEKAIGRRAICNMMPMQAGDVPATWADVGLLRRLTEHTPKTHISQGVGKFVEWYRDYYDAKGTANLAVHILGET